MTNLTRRDYGYINGTIYGLPYPLTLGALQSNNRTQGALHLVDNFPAYTRCLADVEISNEATAPTYSKLFRRIGFLSLANLVEWINNNVDHGPGNFTQGCKIHIYDEIDSTIPPIRKVYGKNTRRASLGSNGWYYHYTGHATAQENWDGAATYLDAVWTYLYGAPLNPGGPGAWTSDDFQCFWFSGSRSTFYACPSPSMVEVRFNSVGSNDRHMRRLADGARVDATLGSWDMSSGTYNAKVVLNRKDGGDIDFHSIGRGNNLMLKWRDDWTMMVAYQLEDSAGNMSILLKPLGVDSFFFNYFDQYQYQLEMVSSRGPQSSWQRLHIIDVSAASFSSGNNSIGPIELGPLVPTVVNATRFSHRRYKPADMYFHLRDMLTNKVSPISPQFVQWTTHRGAATLAPLVRVRPRT